MKTETGEPMTENQMCLRHAEVAEIDSQLNVGDYLVCGDQRQRVTDIYYQSSHACITVVMADGGRIGWHKLQTRVLNAGKGVIVRCSQPTVEMCGECSLSNYGRDCVNNPI